MLKNGTPSVKSRQEKRCFVYVISNNVGDLKIGFAEVVNDRLNELQIGNPERLSVEYAVRLQSRMVAMSVEKKLHAYFHDFAKSGEWFQLEADDVIRYMEAHKDSLLDISPEERAWRDGKKRGRKAIAKTIPKMDFVPEMERRYCKYCGAKFSVKPTSRQIYCQPDVEGKLFFDRKNSLVRALEQLLKFRGCQARDLAKVAKSCVESQYEDVVAGFIALGYTYNEPSKTWRVPSSVVELTKQSG